MGVCDGCIVVLGMTATLLLITSFTLPGWSEQPVMAPYGGAVLSYLGIWEQCFYKAGFLQLSEQLDFLRATEVLCGLGVVFLFISLVCFSTFDCVAPSNRKPSRLGMGVTALLASLVILAGSILFAAKSKTQLDISFGLSVTSSVCAAVGAVLAFCSKPENKEYT